MPALTLELSQLDIEPIEVVHTPSLPDPDLEQLIPEVTGIKRGTPFINNCCTCTTSSGCIGCSDGCEFCCCCGVKYE